MDFINYVKGKGDEPRRDIFDFEEKESNEDVVQETQYNEDEEGDDTPRGPIKQFQVTEFPSHTYSLTNALRLIDEMHKSGQYKESDVELHNRAFKINLIYVNMVQSIGALLRLLDQHRVGVEFEDYSVKTPIKQIRKLTINKLMEIDHYSIMALDIFDNEYHPSATKVFGRRWGNKPQKGMSVFKICNHCSSVVGKLLLKQWFEKPLTDFKAITERHDAVQFFMDESKLEMVKQFRNHLGYIKRMEPILKRFREGTVQSGDWRIFYNTVACSYNIGSTLKESGTNLKILDQYMNAFCPEMMDLLTLFTEVIDFNETAAQDKFSVKRGIDSELDRLKNFFNDMEGFLTEAAKREFEEYHLQGCSVVYVPVLGYLLVLSDDHKPLEGVNITLALNSRGKNYYKTPLMMELDANVGDVKLKIRDMETNTLLKLQKLVVENAGKIRIMIKAVAIVDCVMSFAAVSKELNWCRPTMVKESIIEMTEARHPIAECLAPDLYVPNPVMSGGESYTKVKLLTAPNTSGKSVYLKMIAVCCYLAQIGCYVPATTATIGIIDAIVIRMYTLDSVMDGLSTFAQDMRQMGIALNRGTGNSLVIIDEFGIGTMKEAGLALYASTLNYWLAKGRNDCPHIFASSHFHSLPLYVNSTSKLLSYHTMEVEKKESTLNFFYRLIDGTVTKSYANYIALKKGVPDKIIERSEQVYEELKNGKDVYEIEKLHFDDDERDGQIFKIMDDHMVEFERCETNEDYLKFLETLKTEIIQLFEDDESTEFNFNETTKFFF
uniref:DNA_MISMATCH_REPAIR_2 domain-containing protein n=1 Tax=Parastrongyloides trichosuri TaxID=131310 RepID=A0A0N4ZZA6_PARTI